MADREQLAVLKKGVRAWNRWRAENPKLSVDLRGANLRRRSLKGANFHAGNLQGTMLVRADLTGADLTYADLEGAELEGARLCQIKGAGAAFVSAILHEADLADADLSWSNLGGADFSEACLLRAHLQNAECRAVDFTNADLSEGDLSEADLSESNLNFADLRWANLQSASLYRVEINYAVLLETVLADVNIGTVKGLETCVHHGPSIVDHRTFAKSGVLPLAFLRGCGLPDTLIEYLPSVLRQPIQFYSCFISYSTKDQGFAERLHADLQNAGVRCWFAPHDMQGGKKLHEQIDEAIRFYDRLLLILSEDSMSSDWVQFEIGKARKRELSQKCRVLFPVRLVDYEALTSWECINSVGGDLAEEIRRYFIPDFSNWKDHDSYQVAFQRLLKDLKADAAAAKA